MKCLRLLTLAAALCGLTQARAQIDWASATTDKPVDCTSLITNPSFDNDKDGWSILPDSNAWGITNGTITNGDAQLEKFAEKWTNQRGPLPDASMSQTITGLKKGTYRFSATIIATRQNNAAATQTGTWLVAGSDSVPVSTGNNLPEVKNVDFVLSEDGDVTIKFGTVSTTCNWIAWDNLYLYYYGESLGLFTQNLVKAYEALQEKVNEGNFYTGLATQCNEEIATATAMASSTTDRAAIDAEIAKLNALSADIDANRAAYNNASSAVDSVAAVLEYDASRFDVNSLDSWYSSNFADGYESYAWSTDELNTHVDELYAQIHKCLASGIKAGEECNWMVNNRTFDNNSAAGWTQSGKSAGVVNNTAEIFNHTFDFHQEMKDMPNGTYTLKLKAFFRPHKRENVYENYQNGETINTVAYVNGTSQAVHNIAEGASTTQLNDGDYQMTDGNYIPDNLTGAGEYLKKDIYEVSVTGIVTDGTLRFGVKLDEQTGYDTYWTALRDVTLSYGGENTTELKSQIDALIASAQKLASSPMTKDSLTALNNAINAAQAATSFDDMTTSYSTLQNAVKAAQTSISNYKPLAGALADSKTRTEANNKNDDTDYQTAYKQEETGMNNGDYADADIPTEVIKVLAFTNKALMAGVTGTEASSADVTYVLQSNDFTTNSTTGWNITGNSGYNNNCLEFFNQNFNMTQTLYGMPKGTYILKVQGFYCPGLPASMTEDENVQLFINDQESNLANILTGKQTESKTTGEYKGSDDDGDFYIPNDMAAADYYFETLGLYNDNSVRATVSDDDNTISVGLKKDATVNRDWTIFHKFTLLYIGDATTGIDNIDSDAETVKTEYYTVSGVRVSKPISGVYVVKTTDANGKVSAHKVVKK